MHEHLVCDVQFTTVANGRAIWAMGKKRRPGRQRHWQRRCQLSNGGCRKRRSTQSGYCQDWRNAKSTWISAPHEPLAAKRVLLETITIVMSPNSQSLCTINAQTGRCSKQWEAEGLVVLYLMLLFWRLVEAAIIVLREPVPWHFSYMSERGQQRIVKLHR